MVARLIGVPTMLRARALRTLAGHAVAFVAAVRMLAGCAAEAVLDATPDGDDVHDHEVAFEYDADEIPVVFEDGGEHWVSPVLVADGGATRVSATVELLRSGALVRIDARSVADEGEPSPWTPMVASFDEEILRLVIAEIVPAPAAQLRIHKGDLASITALRWRAGTPLDPEAWILDEARDPNGVGDVGYVAPPVLPGVSILGRQDWGARAGRRACATDSTTRTRITIHHTLTPTDDSVSAATRVRNIQHDHRTNRGFCDIGYHFLIDPDGAIYEGRPLHQRGEHTRGLNSGNIGIALIGCYGEPASCRRYRGGREPSEEMIASTTRLVAALSDHYGISADSSHVRGQNQWPNNQKDCPGRNVLARMEEIRSGAAPFPDGDGFVPSDAPASSEPDPGQAGDGGSAAGSTDAAPPPGRSCSHTYGGGYAHLACSASYQCCDGAWRTRAAGCGVCTCVEESGRAGCTG